MTIPYKRVCYLRPEPNFPIDQVIKLQLCTHIIIAFLQFDNKSELIQDPMTNNFIAFCKQTINQFQSNVKLMFSIGGGDVGGWQMAAGSSHIRKRFVRSIINYIEQFQLDGVDIDWEFPNWPRSLKLIKKQTERDDFTNLLKDIRFEFDNFQLHTGKHLLLSAAVAGQSAIIDVSYQPVEMNKYVDFINLMVYDYYIYKWYWPFLGHNSALHARSTQFVITNKFNVHWAANYWNRIGLPKSKIMVGIPTYAKPYVLSSKNWNYPGAIAKRGKDDYSYSQVCDFLKQNDTIQKFDPEAKVPYAYNKNEWISYENEISAMEKSKWIKRENFGGAMLFSLNADDYRFRCISNRYTIFPLHSAVRDELLGLT